MYAVYLCGATDCFLYAMFIYEHDAIKYAETQSKNPEGYLIKYWACATDVDKSDTGWQGF